MKGQLITGSQAKPATKQHTKPCSDCPWARKSLAGWLGRIAPRVWIAMAHGEGTSECHTRIGMSCAGFAIYRSNVCKDPRDPDALRLPADRIRVFSSPQEFLSHHENGKSRSW